MLETGGRFMTETKLTELSTLPDTATPPAVAHTVEILQTGAEKSGASPVDAAATAQTVAAGVHHDAPAAKKD